MTGLEKLAGAVLRNVGRRSNEEPLCQFIGNFMVQFSSNSSFIDNVAKIFTCVCYLTGLEKIAGAVLWNVGRRSNEEPMCQFIGNFMVYFSSNSSFIENVAKIFTSV